MKKTISFEGLKVRPSYEELINILDKPIFKSYPDRKASQLRNSHWLSQLDGDSYRAMDELHHNMMKEHEKDNLIKSYASSHNMSAASVRSLHSVNGDADFHSVQNSPRASATQYNISTPPPSPRQMDTTTTSQPPVDPSEQQHFSNVPDAPRQSMTKKVKKQIAKSNKFSKMTDTQFDEKVEQQHETNVDDAEMQKQQKQTKSEKLQREYEDMMDDVQTAHWKRTHKLQEEYEDLMNDVNTSRRKRRIAKQEYDDLMKDIGNPNFGGASSSGINEVKKAEKRQANTPPKGRPEAKRKANPPEAEIPKEEPQPKPRGRPRQEPVNIDEPESTSKTVKKDTTKKTIEQTGAKLLHYTKSTWHTKGPAIVITQAQLRRIPEAEGDYLKKNKKKINKADLIKQILEFDAKNK